MKINELSIFFAIFLLQFNLPIFCLFNTSRRSVNLDLVEIEISDNKLGKSKDQECKKTCDCKKDLTCEIDSTGKGHCKEIQSNMLTKEVKCQKK